MFSILYSIAKNTFVETLRQPIYAVIVISSLLLFILAPSISMYTLDEDVKMLRELGLSTLFLAGLFIAVFSATGAITEEIESKTITTVLSKPVGRPVFIAGKFLGVSLAVTLAHYLGTIAYLMAARFGVLESVSDTADMPVVVSTIFVLSLTIIISAFLNYSYDWNLQASTVVCAFILGNFALLFLIFVDKEWRLGSFANHFNLFDVYASILLLLGILILVALAVLFSTRMNVVLTLTCCVAFFLLGLISDWLYGQFAEKYLWARIGSALLPNMQVFWVSDAIYETGKIPLSYLWQGLCYSVSYTTAILALAVAFFQRRQVG